MSRQVTTLIGYLILLTACNGAPAPVVRQNPPAQSTVPSAGNVAASAKRVFGHIIVVVMENQEFTEAERAPYLHKLAQQYAFTRNLTAVSHPSLPNYLALTGGDTFGFDHSCVPGPSCHISGTNTNIADILEGAGLTWKAYLESMPEPCTTENSGRYLVRHDPFVYFDDIRMNQERCSTHVVPFQQFEHDLDAGALPNYAWITPDSCNGMHNRCGIESALRYGCSKFMGVLLSSMRNRCGIDGNLQQGDQWLASLVPKIQASKQFQTDGLLVVTFDEGTSDAGCCSAPGGGRVLTLVISATSAIKSGGWASDAVYNHYSLLRTIEDNWGLPHLGHSGAEDIRPMDDFLQVNWPSATPVLVRSGERPQHGIRHYADALNGWGATLLNKCTRKSNACISCRR